MNDLEEWVEDNGFKHPFDDTEIADVKDLRALFAGKKIVDQDAVVVSRADIDSALDAQTLSQSATSGDQIAQQSVQYPAALSASEGKAE
jgi:hypothetical protein